MKILRPKRLLNRQELRRYMMERLRINPHAVRLTRKERRAASRSTMKEVRKGYHGKVFVIEKPSNWWEGLKETWLPAWGLKLWPVWYTEQ